MGKVTLTLDDFLLDKRDKKDLVAIINKFQVKSEVCECDTHAKGGINWFPTDAILLVVGLTAAGFFAELGKDLYTQLKNKIKVMLSAQKSYGEMIEFFYISFELDNINLYFKFDKITSYLVENSFDKIFSDFDLIEKEVKRLIDFRPNKITGEFNSITFIFDDEENKWIIAHFNKHP